MTMKLRGILKVPGDKSISHRSIMFSSIAKGNSVIKGFLFGADCISTMNCFKSLGIDIDVDSDIIKVKGKGLHGLKKSDKILDCGNSGTTIRLMSGILSAQNFTSILTGDESIRKRPMNRVILPLTQMGADIKSENNGFAPLQISGTSLNGIEYTSPVASAQVKSAILLAGLYANNKTVIHEPALSRNHTELMLKNFGAKIESDNNTIVIYKTDELFATDIEVPSDISSAAYFMAAATLIPNSEIILRNVGINPTRDGILKVLSLMGANIEIINKYDNDELSADILVRSASLKACNIGGDIIPSLIDEIPIIAALCAFADGTSIIKDAVELKVKESNRIKVMTEELSKLGVDIKETDDGMIIAGNPNLKLRPAIINSHKDHRIAMTFSILKLICDGIEILDKDCVNISYPNFYDDLKSILV